MNRLVPYLDLFGRLTDEELARLAGVPASIASNLRRQIVQVDRALARFADLLPRLTDAELVRLTSAAPKTIRFWRLCQPRVPVAEGPARAMAPNMGGSVAQAAEALGRPQDAGEPRRPLLSDYTPLDSGAPLERQPRPPTAEREAPVQHQQAVSQQMGFSGTPFPGYDHSGPIQVEHESDDGIFIGLELPPDPPA